MPLVPFDNDDLLGSFEPFSGDILPGRFVSKNPMAIDIVEKDSCFEVFANIPAGADKRDIKLEFDNGYLTLNVSVNNECKCDPKDENCSCNGRFVVRERYSAQYSRRVYVGDNLDRSGTKASLVKHVLNVTIPKLGDGAKKRFIDID